MTVCFVLSIGMLANIVMAADYSKCVKLLDRFARTDISNCMRIDESVYCSNNMDIIV